ncbi:MAG: RrF2 family transcriptional regulator [Bacteriovoracia bacterium]
MVDTRFSVSVQIMMTLALYGEELVQSSLMARALKSNPTFVRRLVGALVEAGLVQSYRGKGGGLRLAQAPKDISLRDIYSAATANKKLMAAHKKPITRACPVSCCIESVLTDIVGGIEQTTHAYLEKKSLADMMKRVPKKA